MKHFHREYKGIYKKNLIIQYLTNVKFEIVKIILQNRMHLICNFKISDRYPIIIKI